MNAIQLTPAKRFTVAAFASVATVASYFYTMTRGIAAGALIGLSSRSGNHCVLAAHLFSAPSGSLTLRVALSDWLAVATSP
jgi:hypothetical protein